VRTPYAEMIHHESASRSRESTPEQQARFATEIDLIKRRRVKVLTSDAAYSVNPNRVACNKKIVIRQ
jgi:hypothetical protein